jgi:hypothetical protein
MISNVLVHSLYIAMNCDRRRHFPLSTSACYSDRHRIELSAYLLGFFLYPGKCRYVLTLYRIVATLCTTSFNIQETLHFVYSVFKCSVRFSKINDSFREQY